jgi:hypothetical protein
MVVNFFFFSFSVHLVLFCKNEMGRASLPTQPNNSGKPQGSCGLWSLTLVREPGSAAAAMQLGFFPFLCNF